MIQSPITPNLRAVRSYSQATERDDDFVGKKFHKRYRITNLDLPRSHVFKREVPASEKAAEIANYIRQESRIIPYSSQRRVQTHPSLFQNLEEVKQKVSRIRSVMGQQNEQKRRNLKYRVTESYTKIEDSEEHSGPGERKIVKIQRQYQRKEPEEEEDIRGNKFYLPIISHVVAETPFEKSAYYPRRIKVYTRNNYKTLLCFRKFRRTANAVLFVIYLKTYNARMRRNRRVLFSAFVRDQITDKLLEVRNQFIRSSQSFFQCILAKHEVNYLLTSNELPTFRNQKILSTKKFVRLELECIRNCIGEIDIELIYYLCKHGSYALTEPLFTRQQLSNMCVSVKHGYLRADRPVECSNILMLLFVKLLLFNMLLQPEKIHIQMAKSIKNLHNNLKLVGNIIYQLMLQVQDKLLTGTKCQLGKWEQVNLECTIRPSQSMVLKGGELRQGQLISGLHEESYIEKTYEISQMSEQRNLIVSMVRSLHSRMASHHRKIREKFYMP